MMGLCRQLGWVAGAAGAFVGGVCAAMAQGEASVATGDAASAGPIEREVRSGAVRLVVRVARAEIRVGERFEVELEARTDREHDLVLGAMAGPGDELRVVSVRDSAPRRAGDGTLVLVRRVTLEPFLDGEYTIPAMTVTCTALAGADGKAMAVVSEPVRVRVVSNLTEAERGEAAKLDVGAVRAILPAPDESGRSWLWVGVGGVAAGVMGVATGVWIARRRRGDGSGVLEAALPRIRGIRGALEADRASRAEVDELVTLARLCLVERCDARAASMTTEELRRAAVEWPMLAVGEAQKLVEAIAACDVARFAGVENTTALRAAAGAIEDVMERLRYVGVQAGENDAAGTPGQPMAEEVA